MANGPFGFPAEDFLADVPPNYPLERLVLVVQLAFTGLFFLILPIFTAKTVEASVLEDKDNESSGLSTTEAKRNDKTTTVKTSKKNKKSSKVEKQNSPPNEPSSENEDLKVLEIHPLASAFSVIGAVICLIGLVAFTSPDNTYPINGVFQAPLLTREECQTILKFADEAAAVNFQNAQEIQDAMSGSEVDAKTRQLLEDPFGWNKLRHQEYPTTDLNLVTDPFTKEHRDWIQHKLDVRLTPILQRIWGIPPSSVRANDMFVVRYDENKRTRLKKHTDDSYISINVLLDDEFEGGGTRFWNRHTEQPFAHVHPTQVGQILMHNAQINHEGMPLEKGRRSIFVGFLEVDRVDPFQDGLPLTGLSWFSSWGSLAWLATKLKQGYHAAFYRMDMNVEDWKNDVSIRSFFAVAKYYVSEITDRFFEHKLHNLVEDKDREAFLKSLDDAYDNGYRAPGGQANWFSGQQVDIDLTGNVVQNWSTRDEYSHRFNEL